MNGAHDRPTVSVRSGSSPVSPMTSVPQQPTSPSQHEQELRSSQILAITSKISRKSTDIPACDRCRSFKKKCSRTFPICRLCASARQKCSFSIPVTSDEAEVHHLRARLIWLTRYINQGLPVGVPGLESIDTGTDLSTIFSIESPTANFRIGSTNIAATTPSFSNTGAQEALDLRVAVNSEFYEHTGATAILNDDCISPTGHRSVVVQPPVQLPLAEPEQTNLSRLDRPTLPRNAAGRRFVDAYFRNVNTAYPLVDRARVTRKLESIKIMPSSHRSDADSAILYLVMAIGCTTLQRAGQIPGDTISKFDIAYADIIQECLVWENLESIQVLVLLSLHSLFDPDGISTWSIVGIISRMALRLGLSRKESEDKCMSSTEVELRRRLWWSVYVLDRMIAISTGLPVAIVDKNMYISLPGLTIDESTSPEKAYYMSIIQTNRHIIRMRQIEEQILRDVHLRKHLEVVTLSPTDRQAVLKEVRATIEDWNSHGSLMAPPEPDDDNVPFYDSTTWQSARYYHLLVLLYYPCYFNSYGPIPTQKLLQYAQKHLQSTAILLQHRQLPLNRVTLYRLFPIGLVLFHSFLLSTSQNLKLPVHEEVAIIITILESYPDTWAQARTVAQVFRQFIAIVSSISTDSPLQFSTPLYGNIQLEMSGDLYQRMLRPIYLGLVTAMEQVLGDATCYSCLTFPNGFGQLDTSIVDSEYQTPAIPLQRTTPSSTDPFTGVHGGDGSSLNYDWGPLELGFV